MADISKIKVTGVTYDVKDKYSREGGYATFIGNWDGVADGKQELILGPFSMYRYSDAIELAEGQFLIGDSIELTKVLLGEGEDSEMVLITAIMPLFLGADLGPASIMGSSCGIRKDTVFAEICFEMLLENASEEILAEIEELMDAGLVCGINMPTKLITFINTPKNLTLSAELGQFLFSSSSPIEIPAGLWLMKQDLGEEFNYSTYPVFIDTIYTLSPSMSKIMDIGIGKMMYAMFNNVTYYVNKNTNDPGINSMTSYPGGGSSSSNQVDFPKNKKVIVQVTLNSGYVIDSFKVTKSNEESVIVESYAYETGSNTVSYYFYMPDYEVTVTATTVAQSA